MSDVDYEIPTEVVVLAGRGADGSGEALTGDLMVALPVRGEGLPAELPAALASELEVLVAAAATFANHAQAPNTSRAYESDWNQFRAWCDRFEIVCLPASPVAVALYLASLAQGGLAVSTIRRRCAAIERVHRDRGHVPPTADPQVQKVLEGIARDLGAAPKKKQALLRDPLLEVIDRIPMDTNVGRRDRALLLVGFALGLRRSELVALTVEDLSPSPDGLTVRIKKSKTDQQGKGKTLLLAYATAPNPCPVRTLRAWLDGADITSGEIFRRVTRTDAVSSALSAQSVALILKRRLGRAGFKAAEFGGHSLRSGYSTQAARDGHHQTQIADVTRHADQRSLEGYIRAGRGRDDVATVL